MAFCFAGSAAAQPPAESRLDRSPASKFYEPILLFGNPSAPTKLYFFWSAVSIKSLQAFRARITPVAVKKDKADVHVVVYQLLDKSFHDLIGPGAYLLCPDAYSDYASIAARYLADASRVTTLQLDRNTDMYSNAFIRNLVSTKRIDPLKCRSSSDFGTRQVLLAKATREFFAKYKFKALPFYIVDGQYYAADDPRVDKLLTRLLRTPDQSR